LEDNIKDHRTRVRQLEEQLSSASGNDIDVVELASQIADARASYVKLQDSVRRRRTALGVGQCAALQRIRDSLFLQIRMNARAVKTRIRDRLRQRKFELERLERSYRQVVSGG
jgi:hypothetical protein